VPADPLPVRPEALKVLLLRASEAEYGDLYRQHLFDQYKLAINTGLLAVLVLCYGWWRIVRSYRQLSSGKHAVILEPESLLPAAPHTAEWSVLGEGRDPSRYLPLTRVEHWVPRLFALLYLLLLVAVLTGGPGRGAGGGGAL